MKIYVVIENYDESSHRLFKAFNNKEEAECLVQKLNLMEQEHHKFSNLLGEIESKYSNIPCVDEFYKNIESDKSIESMMPAVENYRNFLIENINKFECSGECKEKLIKEVKESIEFYPCYYYTFFNIQEVELV